MPETPRTTKPLYSIGTWDFEEQAFTPQEGRSFSCFNVSLGTLRESLKELRRMGYQCDRRRLANGDYDSDASYVIVERTDGMGFQKILDGWKR